MRRARDIGIRSVRIGCDRVFVDSVDRYLAAWARKLRLRGMAVQRLIARQLGAGMTAVDVGANVGWHTLALARQVGSGGRVVALEPEARAFELLGRAGCRWPHIEARQLAAADYSGWATLYVAPLDQGDHRIVPSGDERERATVRAVSLDDMVADLPRVDFVKISAGGAEVMVLRGLRQTLARQPRMGVLCAVSPTLLERAGAGAEALFTPLREAGLKPHRVMSDGTVEPITASMAWSFARGRGTAPIYFRPA
jgi:FkbM family methyltransferase